MVTRVKTKGRRSLAVALALAVLPMSLAACAERADVTLHEPGVYKGGEDPLLAKQQNPQNIETLQDRFAKGQSDR
jgi:cobalamin biosynthesis protein CobD/CbiB